MCFWQFFPCDFKWCESGLHGVNDFPPTLAASFPTPVFSPQLLHPTPHARFSLPPRSPVHRGKCDKCRLPYLFHSVQWSSAESTPTAGKKPSAQETWIGCAKETMVSLNAFGFPDGLSAQWTIQTRWVGIWAAGGKKTYPWKEYQYQKIFEQPGIVRLQLQCKRWLYTVCILLEKKTVLLTERTWRCKPNKRIYSLNTVIKMD